MMSAVRAHGCSCHHAQAFASARLPQAAMLYHLGAAMSWGAYCVELGVQERTHHADTHTSRPHSSMHSRAYPRGIR
jgi:hypothetical protein